MSEWEIHQITLPADDYDEDDEIDARLEEAERRRKKHIERGRFFSTS
jgi:hypothetical protein